MPRSFWIHTSQLTCLSLWFYGVCIKDSEMHMPQLLEAENIPGNFLVMKNDQQKDKFRKIIHIAQPTKRLN